MENIRPIDKPVKRINVSDFTAFTVEGWVIPEIPELTEAPLLSKEEIPEVEVVFYEIVSGTEIKKYFNMCFDKAIERLNEFNKTHKQTRCVRVSKVNEYSACKESRITYCAPMQDPPLWSGYRISSGATVLSEEYLIPDADAEIEELVELYPEFQSMLENLGYVAPPKEQIILGCCVWNYNVPNSGVCVCMVMTMKVVLSGHLQECLFVSQRFGLLVFHPKTGSKATALNLYNKLGKSKAIKEAEKFRKEAEGRVKKQYWSFVLLELKDI